MDTTQGTLITFKHYWKRRQENQPRKRCRTSSIYTREKATPFLRYITPLRPPAYTHPPFWGLTQTKVGYLLSFNCFICCMKLSEHINRISCTYYFHFQRSSNFYHIWQQLNDWARYLKAISLNWTTSKTAIGLKTNPTPILRTLNTLSWFLCSRCQKMLSHSYFAHFEYAELISLFSMPKNALPPSILRNLHTPNWFICNQYKAWMATEQFQPAK
jgi:hypothetical protein